MSHGDKSQPIGTGQQDRTATVQRWPSTAADGASAASARSSMAMPSNQD